MTKYSTGSGGGGDDGDACELCGTESASLRKANVAGAELLVCGDCAPMGANRNKDRKKREQQGGSRGAPENRKKRAAQNTAKLMDSSSSPDTDWVEGAKYEEDSLPYLVSGYGDRVVAARQDAGLTSEELAAEIDVDEDDLLAVEEGRATRADVGGSVIAKLEDRFGIQLAE
ncbi:multiprotein-bridging factor 1 family protein [Halolamina litorea]|uniref:Multiprotein-bridging factor 1 family protein n=1 Tax=Halolamina litorea TaxID=1515593 RepID=A0ABD6BLF3_9EURY|nr:multiprotein-bridging factor 1 family protein [Halolamina litorea]